MQLPDLNDLFNFDLNIFDSEYVLNWAGHNWRKNEKKKKKKGGGNNKSTSFVG